MGGSTAAAGAIFVASITLILLRPWRISDWSAALAGGLLMVLVGLLPATDALAQLAGAWNVFLFFLGLGIASATADRAGVFRWAASRAVDWAGGSQRRLMVAIFVVGVVVSAVLSNDATALLLTPVVFAIATRAGVDPRPYAFACALVANAASFVLPVSNPSNLLIMARAPLPFSDFLVSLALPSLLALVATLSGLLVVFRGELAANYHLSRTLERSQRRTRIAGVGVIGLAAAYVVAAAFEWPLGIVAVVGAFGLLGLDALSGELELGATAREVPWAILPLFGGLLLLVGGGERVGLFAPLEHLVALAAAAPGVGPPLLTLSLALLANVLNNLPAAMVSASALGSLPAGTARDQLAAAAIVGLNLGPNLTTVGSLATMLWLLLLRRRGVDITPLSYLRIGGAITLPALLAATLGVSLALR